MGRDGSRWVADCCELSWLIANRREYLASICSEYMLCPFPPLIIMDYDLREDHRVDRPRGASIDLSRISSSLMERTSVARPGLASVAVIGVNRVIGVFRKIREIRVPQVIRSILLIFLAAAMPAVSRGDDGGEEAGLPGVFGQVSGRHLTLITDLPLEPAVEQLPAVFDAAIAHWCEYFQVPLEKTRKWHLRGYLIQNRDRFAAHGLIPADLPPFLHGFQRGDEFWFLEQPSEYYRRHLMLHEGTHAFMSHFLGGWGPTWYMEGVAEFLATHQLDDQGLRMGIMPARRDEVPNWGRVRLVREAWQQNQRLSLVEIMRLPPEAHLRVETYGWSWAAVQFFDQNPEYQAAFRHSQGDVRDESIEFSRQLARRIMRPWADVELQWQDFVAQLDYGYDVSRAILRFADSRPLSANGAEVVIQADRGWQESGVRVEAGRAYQLGARGRFQVHDQPRPWWSEPDGVTLRYIEGRPLGVLLAAVVPRQQPRDPQSEAGALRNPIVVGSQSRLVPATSGMLYFRINDSPAELAGNQGELTVRIRASESDR
jgi:hypothetical protein